MNRSRGAHSRGLARSELVAVMVVLLVLATLLAPVLARVSGLSANQVSLNNLRVLHGGHTCYAADWADRQFTAVPDDLSELGGTWASYTEATGSYPPLLLGWGPGAGGPICEPGYTCGRWAYWGDWPGNNFVVTLPISFDSTTPSGIVGAFRLGNAWPLHEYMAEGTGRFYDPVFYSPLDRLAYETIGDADFEFDPALPLVTSSYVLSPAAMYHPEVLRPRSEGGYQDPASFAEGFQSPPVSQVVYADLKSRLIEHAWLTDPPGPCNETFTDPHLPDSFPCSQYLFNHGAEAAPLTLFFDGSIQPLRTGDVAAADELLLKSTGDGLWSRDTPLGELGYFGEASFDRTVVSHHILTTGGIQGRDRLR